MKRFLIFMGIVACLVLLSYEIYILGIILAVLLIIAGG